MDDIMNKSSVGLEEMKCIASTDLCDAYGRSGIGGCEENQDSYSGIVDGQNVIMTVCDGMGGMNGGQTASRIAVTEIVQSLAELIRDKVSVDAIRIAVETANAAIYRRALNDPPLRGMGTTATVLVVTPYAAYLTHVGDSRIYQLRKGRKVFRTFDHSRVFEMVAQNLMTEEQARQSCFSNVITRALGIRPQVQMDVEIIPFKQGDRFILCCDGIWNSEPEHVIMKFFDEEKTADAAVCTITERVNYIGYERGGEHDNLTAIVVDMKKDSEYQYSCWHRAKDAMVRQCRNIKKLCAKKNKSV